MSRPIYRMTRPPQCFPAPIARPRRVRMTQDLWRVHSPPHGACTRRKSGALPPRQCSANGARSHDNLTASSAQTSADLHHGCQRTSCCFRRSGRHRGTSVAKAEQPVASSRPLMVMASVPTSPVTASLRTALKVLWQ